MGFFKELKKIGKQIATAAAIVGVGILTGGTAWAGWAAFATRVAITAALSYAASALAPKPPSYELKEVKRTSRNPIAPRRTIYGTSRVGGTIVAMASTGEKNEYLHMVVTIASHQITSLQNMMFNDQVVWSGGSFQDDWGDFATISFHDGDDNQLADSTLVSDFPDWTSDHRLRGVAYAYVRIKYDQTKFAMGIPNITFTVQGKKVFNGTSYVFSSNPVYCLYDYLVDNKYGMKLLASDINADAFLEAASVCDETVTTVAGSQARYTLDGVVDHSEAPIKIIEDMMSSMGGIFSFTGGEFHVYASKYYTPTVNFDESDIVSDISVSTKPSRRMLYNGVKGVFFSADNNFTAMDYPPVISSAYELEDGDPLYLDLNLPYTTDPTRAQRLAKLVLLQGRQHTSATFSVNAVGLNVSAGDFITVSNTHLGWTDKVFRVVGYDVSVDTSNGLVAKLTIVETSSAVFDWTTDDETPFVAGISTTLPNVFDAVPAPTGLSVSSGADIVSDGTSRPYFIVSWNGNDGFTYQYEVQYYTGANAPQSIITGEESVRLEDIIAGASYTIQVRAINNLGQQSAFTSTTSSGVGDSVAPNAPTGLTATPSLESVTLDWDSNTESDFAGYAVYRNTVNNSATATQIAKVSADLLVLSGLDTQTRYYWVRAYDFSGNYSGFSNVASAAAESPVTDAPRSANGYIYYQSASLTEPSPAPTASGYDFTNGTFSSLTSGWAVTPPTMTAGDNNNYWYVKYTVLEQSYEGAQDVDIGSVLLGTGFTGLVTFTNNDYITGGEVDANITTIDGGVITTNTIDVSKLIVGHLDGFTISVGTGHTINSKAFEITSTGVLWADNLVGGVISGDNSYYQTIIPVEGRSNGSTEAVRGIVYATNSDSNAHGVRGWNAYTGSSGLVGEAGGSAFYAESGGYGPFTGIHDALVLKTDSFEAGDILIDVTKVASSGVSDQLFTAEASSRINQSAIGIYTKQTPLSVEGSPAALKNFDAMTSTEVTDPNTGEISIEHNVPVKDVIYDYIDTHDRALVNALGEGSVNVCGENGDIEVGDLIVTSSIAGKGMRQSDDIVRGYTVAKSREAVTFSSPDEIKQIACIYLCG